MSDPTFSSPIRALIVDDHRLFNDGLQSMLSDEPTIEVVGQVYQSKDASYAVARLLPDILLMDFNMPGINGLDLARQLLSSFPELRILVLSMYNQQSYIDEFRKAGVKGYILKTIDVNELVTVIKTIIDGKTYYTRIDRPDTHADDRFIKKLGLTKREMEVINYIRQALTTQQIADTMGVSFYTIETHRRNIYLKLDVKSTAELILFMDENK